MGSTPGGIGINEQTDIQSAASVSCDNRGYSSQLLSCGIGSSFPDENRLYGYDSG